MLSLLIWIIIFIVSLAILVKSSDIFTDSSEELGLYYKLPKFVIGVTIMAIGTSLPELVSSIAAIMQNNSEIVTGTVVGSNIANILLVFGVIAMFSKKFKLKYNAAKVDIPIFFIATSLLIVFALDGSIKFFEGIILLTFLILYLFYTIKKKGAGLDEEIEQIEHISRMDIFKEYLTLVISLFFIMLSANFTIKAVTNISELVGIGKELIALSVVAFGTSLPELMVSISSIKKNNVEMAIGNILGSNIFNILAVVGIPAIFKTLIVAPSLLSIAIPFLIIASISFVLIIQYKEINKWEGIMLLLIYVIFILKTFNLL